MKLRILKQIIINCVSKSKDRCTVRSEFAYFVHRTLNRAVPAYRTSVQFLKRTVPWYGTFFSVLYLQLIWLNNDPLVTYATDVGVFFIYI